MMFPSKPDPGQILANTKQMKASCSLVQCKLTVVRLGPVFIMLTCMDGETWLSAGWKIKVYFSEPSQEPSGGACSWPGRNRPSFKCFPATSIISIIYSKQWDRKINRLWRGSFWLSSRPDAWVGASISKESLLSTNSPLNTMPPRSLFHSTLSEESTFVR